MINKLSKICNIVKDADLTSYNTFHLHSKCKVLILISNEKELISVLNIVKEYKEKYFIIGNGSNIILSEYYDGVIIKLDGLNKYEINNDELYVESGAMINKVALYTVNLGYEGIDFATGIPGTIGGCIYGNAGCYGSSISDVLISIRAYDGQKIIELQNKDLSFSYRYSNLKEKLNYVILSAKFKINKTNIDELKSKVVERTKKRIQTQDLTHPSNGSVFRNPEGFIAGKLIDDANLKGTRVNDAVVSSKHANFIINDGNATSEDIISLIKIVRSEIKKVYNIDLVLEQEIIK